MIKVICGHCKMNKPISEFGKDKQTKSGYKNWCRLCRRQDSKTRYRDKCKGNSECREKLAAYVIKRRNESPEKFLASLFQSARQRAKRTRIYFELTQDDILELNKKQNGKCFYSGADLTYIAGNGKVDTNASLERLNPGLGYVKGNVVLCAYYVNVSKRDKDIESWILWALKVKEYQDAKSL